MLESSLFNMIRNKNKVSKDILRQTGSNQGNIDLVAFMYEMYADDLYSYGLSLRANTNTIEDAMHDVFIDMYMNNRVNNISDFGKYLKTAFRHRLIFLLRGNKRYVEFVNDISNVLFDKNCQDKWIEQEEEEKQKRLIENLLSDLTQHQREAIYLRFVDGHSYNDISEIMQINYQSVKSLIHRAMFSIRTKNALFELKHD